MLVVWVMMISGIFAQYGDDPSEPSKYLNLIVLLKVAMKVN